MCGALLVYSASSGDVPARRKIPIEYGFSLDDRRDRIPGRGRALDGIPFAQTRIDVGHRGLRSFVDGDRPGSSPRTPVRSRFNDPGRLTLDDRAHAKFKGLPGF